MFPHPKPRALSALALLAVASVITSQLCAPTAWAFKPRLLLQVTGTTANGDLGYSVSGAGDVNGDGFADVIVGERFFGASGPGRATVYYGGPSADAVADLVLSGESIGDLFGYSVSGAGDVNGDGYDDVIVGAPLNDAGGSPNAGRAYVFYGGPGADAIADLTMTGTVSGGFPDELGISVSGAGDVNGDGFPDMIVGAPGGGVSDTGSALIYFGGPGADGVADRTLLGQATNDEFGTSVAGAGDVNGDGHGDVIVGAQFNSALAFHSGRAYVYYGGPGADAVADIIMMGGEANDLFGGSVSSAGDMNGDGFDDVIVGSDLFGGLGLGQADVFFGGPNPETVADLVLLGVGTDQFGTSVSGAGDVNADGYSDVIVGAPLGATVPGTAYVYYGGPGIDTAADVTLTGEAATDQLGFSVSGAGDVDGDGYDDVITGAHFNDAGGSNAGKAYVYTSRPYEVLAPDGGEQWVAGRPHMVRWLGAYPADLSISFDAGASYSLLASQVGGAERNEFAVTAPTHETPGAKIRLSASGEAVTHASSDATDGVFRIVTPSIPPAVASRLQLAPTGPQNNASLGRAVAFAGDVNGDGYDDVIAGAPSVDITAIDAGIAYVYFGGPGADDVADLTLFAESAGDNFGWSVASAGDVNGDGFADMIVGAPENDAGGAGAGRAYIYFGGASPDNAVDRTLTGAAFNDHYGTSVASAGDVNRDGYDDFMVGADRVMSNSGRAYVYFGGPLVDVTADWTFTGMSSEALGKSLSSAGDVNGDGYSDVIVGAFNNLFEGRAYVFFGGTAPDAVSDLTMTGPATASFFGSGVAGVGDVNGDGHPDLAVGANGVAALTGRAYVFYGGPEMDEVADLTLHGEAAGDFFGTSVASAGDVNADGFADLVVGAFGSNASGSVAGRAYVFFGSYDPDAVADVVFSGGLNANLGLSVASGGDVNGDGCSDVILGAPSANAGAGFSQGRVEVYDMRRYHLTAPNGGETWHVGSTKTVAWRGAEPADIWLSVDGGDTHQLIESSVGGAATNTIAIRVPHTPTKFARLKVTPADSEVGGFDRSDSMFTIQTSVALLSMLAAPLPDGGKGALVTWSTNPGPEDLAGYRLDRAQGSAASSADWRTLVALTRETSYTDLSGGPGTRYRLFAVNGFGEELWLGEASIRPLAPLAAWPVPFRGGDLTVSFAAAGGLGGGGARTEVGVFDVSGRLVRRLASGVYGQGHYTTTWDGRDSGGRRVAAGIYFLRSSSGGEQSALRVAVLR